jgi:hypothetical protein
MIKIKDAGNGDRCIVYFNDKTGEKIKEGPSFNSKSVLWADSEEWLKNNEILPQFTDDELAQKETEETEAAATAYIGLRKSEYPPIGDQLDYIYHNGIEAWKTDIITPVKEKYPKPG